MIANSHSPKVSVIIPAFNVAAFIAEAIQSVLTQTFDDFEIVVVDDGSTDDTPTVVKAFDDPRVTYLYQSNLGLAGARNTGIAHARGKYVAFLDADDVFLPQKLEWQTKILDNRPDLGLVAGGFLFTDAFGKPLAERQPWRYAPDLDTKTWLHGCPFVVHSILVRREWLERVGGFDSNLRRKEDVDLWLRLAYHGCSMAWDTNIVCVYRMHGDQMVRDGRDQQAVGLALLDKFFAQPDLPSHLRVERQNAYAYQYLEGACRQYAVGQVDTARQSLATTIEMKPGLMNGEIPPLISTLVSWALDPTLGDPMVFIERLLDNLPPIASGLNDLKERIFYQVAVQGAVQANRVGNSALAQQYLRQLSKKTPSAGNMPNLVVELLVDCIRSLDDERQVEAINTFFDSLPSELADLGSFRRKALGRFYIARGFEAHETGAAKDAARAMWQGIRFDPVWLRNRGIWSIMLGPLLRYSD